MSILKRRWTPLEDTLQRAARDTFTQEVFGEADDFGDHLFKLNTWHHSREWSFDALTPGDGDRAAALEAFSVLTRMRLREAHGHPTLNLQLAQRAPHICELAFPMVVKIPVTAVRFFLDVHATFAFNSIRQAKHPKSNEIIAYLYELLFLQQKTAIALHEYMRLAAYAAEHKKHASLINAEVDVIMKADLVFSYLKASIEKTIALAGATHGLTDLEAKKTHKSKLQALRSAMPNAITKTHYAQFLLDAVASENIDDLNSYRSGLLHKKGIADLQPHNYVHVGARETPLPKIFGVLHEQHAKNTATLIAALAILTDNLAERDPPTAAIEEMPMWIIQTVADLHARQK
jgi:hypothetical protein